MDSSNLQNLINDPHAGDVLLDYCLEHNLPVPDGDAVLATNPHDVSWSSLFNMESNNRSCSGNYFPYWIRTNSSSGHRCLERSWAQYRLCNGEVLMREAQSKSGEWHRKYGRTRHRWG